MSRPCGFIISECNRGFVYRCSKCDRDFKNAANFENHFHNEHAATSRNSMPSTPTHENAAKKVKRNEEDGLSAFRSVPIDTNAGGTSSGKHKIPDIYCGFCSDKFTSEKARTSHLGRYHAIILEHQCYMCNKRYETEAKLNTHMKGVHDILP